MADGAVDRLKRNRAARGGGPGPMGTPQSSSPGVGPVGGDQMPTEVDETTPIDSFINLMSGVAKGAGSTIDTLSAPIMKAATKGFDPAGKGKRFSDVANLNVQPGAETVGRELEQLAEFFLPAGAAKKAAIGGLVRLIPDAASPATMSKLNKLAAFLGRTGGEAASAYGVSAAQGSQNPEDAALAAGGMGALGHLAKPAAHLVSGTIGRKVAPVLGAGAFMRALPRMGGFGSQMGMYGLVRQGLSKAMDTMVDPHILSRRTLNTIDKYGRGFANTVGKGAAFGTEDQPRRRRIPKKEEE